jgi:hypothetical protein
MRARPAQRRDLLCWEWNGIMAMLQRDIAGVGKRCPYLVRRPTTRTKGI